MTTLAGGFGAAPSMTIDAVGYGAGTADTPERANVVQVVIGEATAAGAAVSDAGGSPVVLLEANVDDVTGEVLADAVAALLAAGAHDAWLTPIVMKKGRPAHTVSVLCDPTDAARLRGAARRTDRDRSACGRRRSSAGRNDGRWRPSRSTVTRSASRSPDSRVKVEFDDAARAATALGRPVAEIISRAEAAGRALEG